MGRERGVPVADRTVPQGLYDPRFDHDSCGVAFVAGLHGGRRHGILEMAISALANLEHRGATGAETNSGDGAGVLIQMPDRFLCAAVDFDLPEPGAYAAGMAFLPREPAAAAEAASRVEGIAACEGLKVLGWRDVPHDDSMIGGRARAVMPPSASSSSTAAPGGGWTSSAASSCSQARRPDRPEGELHLFNPNTIALLQQAVRTDDYETFKLYSQAVNDHERSLATLRGLFRFREDVRPPVPLDPAAG